MKEHHKSEELVEEPSQLHQAIAEYEILEHKYRLLEARLRERENLCDTLFQASPSLCAVINADGKTMMMNQAMLHALGYTLEEVIGADYLDTFVPESERESLSKIVQNSIDKHKTILNENHVIAKDGRRLLIEWHARPVFKEDGKLDFLFGLGRDITERKLTEAALRESQRTLSTLMSNLPGMAYRCKNDRDWTAEFISDGCLALTGYQPQDIMQNRQISLAEITHPKDLESVRSGVQEALQQKKPYCLTYRIITSSGEERWVWEQGVGVRSSKDDLVALEGFITDITEQKLAEEALRESQRTLSTLMSNLPGMAYRCKNDQDWTVEFVSDGCLALTGYQPQDFTARGKISLGDITHPKDLETVRRGVHKALQQKRPYCLTYRMLTSSGEQRWVWEQGVGVRSPKGGLVALEGFITDITEQKLAEKELRKYQDHLERLVEERTADLLESEKNYLNLNRQLNTVISSSSDGIWVCDGHGTIITINKASEKLNGIKAEDFIGKNITDILETGLVDRSVVVEVLETKRQVSIIQHVRKTNKYPLVTGTPVLDEDENILMVTVNERDMSLLNAIKEQLEQNLLITAKFKDELMGLSMLELENRELVVASEKMKQVLGVAFKLSRLGVSDILVLGESGVGKGYLAKFIHMKSERSNKPFIQINCAALPENLLEAELFGYERGAFTGAREQGKAGLFELAHEGTLFLDEIGDIPYSIQAKLLKYLDDHKIMRLGGVKPKEVNCSIIAATNRDLEALVKQKLFREDLLYRLNVFTILIPPLRERSDDIFELANHFLLKYTKQYSLKRHLTPQALQALQSHPFPGNVRELKNIIKRAVVMSEDEVVDEHVIRSLASGAKTTYLSLSEEKSHGRKLIDEVAGFERDIIMKAMRKCNSTREMAHYLGINQSSVVRKMRKHGLARS